MVGDRGNVGGGTDTDDGDAGGVAGEQSGADGTRGAVVDGPWDTVSVSRAL